MPQGPAYPAPSYPSGGGGGGSHQQQPLFIIIPSAGGGGGVAKSAYRSPQVVHPAPPPAAYEPTVHYADSYSARDYQTSASASHEGAAIQPAAHPGRRVSLARRLGQARQRRKRPAPPALPPGMLGGGHHPQRYHPSGGVMVRRAPGVVAAFDQYPQMNLIGRHHSNNHRKQLTKKSPLAAVVEPKAD